MRRFALGGIAVLATLLRAVFAAPPAAAQEWPQWGGPGRDFHVPGVTLAASWPEDGPPELWRRELGEGYSAIAAAAGRLVTMYRLAADEEIVVALAPDSGETLWQHRYPASLEGLRLAHGRGPHSTPLVTGGRVFAVGTAGRLSALDATDGEPLWSHELWEVLRGSRLYRGYGSSPIAYRELVITVVGGDGRGVMAFDQTDGRIVWQSQDFKASQSSPILVEVGGRRQLVVFVTDTVAGLDPETGALWWQHPHPSGAAYNLSTPVWGADDRLFISSAYGGGSRMLRLAVREGETAVEELWYQTRMKIHFTNAVRLGDQVYGSTGRSGAKMLAAVDVRSGELAWRDRAIGRSNLVVVGDKVVVLDEDGRLLLVRLSPEGLEILAQTRLFDGQSWTVPTLVGRRLYARDEESVVALELAVVETAP